MHTIPIVQTLNDPHRRLRVNIGFSPILDRFVINPATNHVVVETYREAITTAQTMLEETTNHVVSTCVQNICPAHITAKRETLYKMMPSSMFGRESLEDEEGNRVSHHAGLPALANGKLYVAGDDETFQTVQRNAAYLNLTVQSLLTAQNVVSAELPIRQLLNVLLLLRRAELPLTLPVKDHYGYTDSYQGRHHRMLEAYNPAVLLYLIWCLHILHPKMPFDCAERRLVLLGESYAVEKSAAKDVTALYRKIAAHLSKHPLAWPVGYTNNKVVYAAYEAKYDAEGETK